MTLARTRPLVAGVVSGLLALVIGMTVADAALVAVVGAGLALLWWAGHAGVPDPWRSEHQEEAPGTRVELAALTWTFVGRDGRVSEPAVRRLRRLAEHRLARAGVVVPGGIGPARGDGSPERERARALLGEPAWRALTIPGGLLPTLPDVARCVDALEALDVGAGSRPDAVTGRTMTTDPATADPATDGTPTDPGGPRP